jgi:hypothetical protein
MTTQLPDYLKGRQSRAVAERAVAGLGASLPPHISIRGNNFTLVDAAGEEDPIETKHLDVCIADISDVICKQLHDKAWTPDSKDPPVCFSANGIAPSQNASQPQARTCAECPKNVRGSAVSKISGAAIKACRDEKWLAVIPVGVPDVSGMLFQLKLTPGSFKSWQGLNERFRGQTIDLSDVVVRLTFERDSNGTLEFAPTGYIDQPTFQLREKALVEKATDVLVGRNDVPRQGALPAPSATVDVPSSGTVPAAIPNGATSAAFMPGASFATQQTAAPPVAAESNKRTRRTRAEMEAARAQPDPNAAAPFRPQTPPPAQPSNGVFGMQQPAPVTAELNRDLDALFGPAPTK